MSVEGMVVGGVDHGDADRIVHLLTVDGRLAAFAHGARKSRRRFSGALEPFTTLSVELSRSRRSDGVNGLAGAEVVRTRLALSKQLETLSLASYACELAWLVSPEGAPTEVYGRLTMMLDVLVSTQAATRAMRRAFEIGVLDDLGFQPQLDGCPKCGATGVYLDLRRGGLFCERHREGGKQIGPRTLAWMRLALGGHVEPESSRFSAADEDRAARAVGPILDQALEGLLERRMKSKALIVDLGL